MSPKYLVIGSNSFSGSNFINFLLNKRTNVIGVSRSKEINKVFLPYKFNENINLFKFFKVDLNKDLKKLLTIVKKYKPAFIINFAAQGMVAQSWNRPEDWYFTNVLSQVMLHDELRKMKFLKKYIHITTPEVYGNQTGWTKENFKFNPTTPYAVSRASCDLHLKSFYENYKFPVIFTRASNVYGPCQQLYRVIPKAIICSRLGKKMQLHGGGKSLRSFIYIDDVSKAIFKIIQKGIIGKTYHISTNKVYSIKKIIKKICTYTSVNFKDLVDITDDRAGKDHAYLLNSSNIRKNIKWNDEINLDIGIKKTINWVDKNLKVLKNASLIYKHKK